MGYTEYTRAYTCKLCSTQVNNYLVLCSQNTLCSVIIPLNKNVWDELAQKRLSKSTLGHLFAFLSLRKEPTRRDFFSPMTAVALHQALILSMLIIWPYFRVSEIPALKNCLLSLDVHMTTWDAIPQLIPFLTRSAWSLSWWKARF